MKSAWQTVKRHQTVTGRSLAVTDLRPKVVAFLARLEAMVENPTVGERDLIRLVWSSENPLLDTTIVPGKAFATRQTYENPTFRTMLDLIDRKRVQVGTLDLARAVARYTMTVPEAAEALGIHETSVRAAIKAGRLAAWKRGGTYYIDPVGVHSYRVSTRGQRAKDQVHAIPDSGFRSPLVVRWGAHGDYIMKPPRIRPEVARLKGENPERMLANWHRVPSSDAELFEAELPQGWRETAILFGNKRKGSYRCFVLEHDDAGEGAEPTVFRFDSFIVQGRFKVVKKINNPKEALDAYKGFVAK